MLQVAQLFQTELQELITGTWYQSKYMYYSARGDNIPQLPDNNYNSHHFVSLNHYGNIIGYISYNIDWIIMSACDFGIINFGECSITFAKDVYKVVCDLFGVYHMNRIEWLSYADNPAIRGYRNFIRKHGGRECAYYRQVAKLADGKLHDCVCFEILASEFQK